MNLEQSVSSNDGSLLIIVLQYSYLAVSNICIFSMLLFSNSSIVVLFVLFVIQPLSSPASATEPALHFLSYYFFISTSPCLAFTFHYYLHMLRLSKPRLI